MTCVILLIMIIFEPFLSQSLFLSQHKINPGMSCQHKINYGTVEVGMGSPPTTDISLQHEQLEHKWSLQSQNINSNLYMYLHVSGTLRYVI